MCSFSTFWQLSYDAIQCFSIDFYFLSWVQHSIRIDFDIFTFPISFTRNEFSSPNSYSHIQLYPLISPDTCFDILFSSPSRHGSATFTSRTNDQFYCLRTQANIRLRLPSDLLRCYANTTYYDLRPGRVPWSCQFNQNNVLRTIFRRECSWFHQ